MDMSNGGTLFFPFDFVFNKLNFTPKRVLQTAESLLQKIEWIIALHWMKAQIFFMRYRNHGVADSCSIESRLFSCSPYDNTCRDEC